jgi:hypothetical protein
MVQYEDVETKTVKYIPFVNGKALLPIPKGYTEKKAAAPVEPVAPVVPLEDQAALARAGGGGGGGGGGKSEIEGGGVAGEPNDAGIEGFGDIQGGINPNIARAAGFAAGFINPVVGLLVSAAGAYATKENNKKMAAANAQAIDASALAAAGFDARDIKSAQEAAAKATLEGKSAKDIAVAAANAASLGTGPGTAKTSLDALVGITNGFNTANKDVMAMPKELADKVEPRTWNDVVKAIQEGLTPEQAVQKVAETTFAADVGSYFTGTLSDKEVSARLSAAGLEGSVPAGKYDSVVKDLKDGLTPEQAISKALQESMQESIAERVAADNVENADRFAREQEKSEREASDKEAAAREATNQANLNAAREAADRAEAQQAAADRAEAQQAAAEKEQDFRLTTTTTMLSSAAAAAAVASEGSWGDDALLGGLSGGYNLDTTKATIMEQPCTGAGWTAGALCPVIVNGPKDAANWETATTQDVAGSNELNKGSATIKATSEDCTPSSTIRTRLSVPVRSTDAMPTDNWKHDSRSNRDIGKDALAASAKGKSPASRDARRTVGIEVTN